MDAQTREPTEQSAIPPFRNFDVKSRVVVITGAGQGIGREYALQFAQCGAVVIIAELEEAKGNAVADQIRKEGGSAYAYKVDVSDEDSVQKLVIDVLAAHSRIDVLINNAAIFATLKMRPFEEIPLAEWDRVLAVNVTGVFLMSRAVTPAMRQAGWGRIVNITSASVPLGLKNYLHYVTSKSALIGMTNAMARELGTYGITVNAIQPSATFTEVPRETVNDEGKKRVVASQCIPREEIPTDLIGLVMFLASEASAFVTGQTIACDGGLTHW
jgi:NAD(P)-dependent dehydrogenase (short-subunit alcohol dehydrogenase family)